MEYDYDISSITSMIVIQPQGHFKFRF
jgi:hypothetical protein